MPIMKDSKESFNLVLKHSTQDTVQVLKDLPEIHSTIEYSMLWQQLQRKLHGINKERQEALTHDTAVSLVTAYIEVLFDFLPGISIHY